MMNSQVLAIEPEQVRLRTAEGECVIANDHDFFSLAAGHPSPSWVWLGFSSEMI